MMDEIIDIIKQTYPNRMFEVRQIWREDDEEYYELYIDERESETFEELYELRLFVSELYKHRASCDAEDILKGRDPYKEK